MDKVIFAVIAEIDDENEASWPMKSKRTRKREKAIRFIFIGEDNELN
jgi:hypothetical protein